MAESQFFPTTLGHLRQNPPLHYRVALRKEVVKAEEMENDKRPQGRVTGGG